MPKLPDGCWAEEGTVAVDLADAQRDEGNAETSGQHAHLGDLEVLREVRYEAVLGGGA